MKVVSNTYHLNQAQRSLSKYRRYVQVRNGEYETTSMVFCTVDETIIAGREEHDGMSSWD